MKLELVPVTLKEVNAFVDQYHRHRGPVAGAKFCIAVAALVGPGSHDFPEIVGAAIVGSPVGRHLEDTFTLEVNRLCTNGTRNVCSMLYDATWCATKALGYARLITYTLASEPGASLRAAGWRVVGVVKGRSWSTPSRPHIDTAPMQGKLHWKAA